PAMSFDRRNLEEPGAGDGLAVRLLPYWPPVTAADTTHALTSPGRVGQRPPTGQPRPFGLEHAEGICRQPGGVVRRLRLLGVRRLLRVEVLPPEDKNATLFIWAIFAVTFLMRPIGAWYFGRFADRFGRRLALTVSITLMAACSFA